MHKVDAKATEGHDVDMPGAKAVKFQSLLDDRCGAPNFAMRRFVIAAGGHTPQHSHDWEHEVYIVRGRGQLVTDEGEAALCADCAAFVPPGQMHQFSAAADEGMEMICMVPLGPATQR